MHAYYYEDSIRRVDLNQRRAHLVADGNVIYQHAIIKYAHIFIKFLQSIILVELEMTRKLCIGRA